MAMIGLGMFTAEEFADLEAANIRGFENTGNRVPGPLRCSSTRAIAGDTDHDFATAEFLHELRPYCKYKARYYFGIAAC